MSLAATVIRGIKTARAAMGDLVRVGVLIRQVGKTYDTSKGEYHNSTEPENVEYVRDKFSYEEVQSGEFRQTDVRVIVFNVSGVTVVSVADTMIVDGITYNVVKSQGEFVGTIPVVWTVTLRI